MKWFARGGTHMNYYMYTGGNNYGRWTGDSITQMYAVDAIVCPDGLPHQPKYDQTTAMHRAIAGVAAEIAGHPAQLNQAVSLPGKASAYVYGSVAFIETAGGSAEPIPFHGHTFNLPAGSCSLVDLTSGAILFNTQTLVVPSAATKRQVRPAGVVLEWTQWAEPVVGSAVPPGTYPNGSVIGASQPVEMTAFSSVLPPSTVSLGATSRRSTFAFYEAQIGGSGAVPTSLTADTFQAMSLSVYLDGVFAGEAHDLSHSSGSAMKMTVPLAAIPTPAPQAISAAASARTLTILAEELGYANYGFKGQLKKGVEGVVSVDGAAVAGKWTMRGGLAGEHLKLYTTEGANTVTWAPATSNKPATWYRTSFASPAAVMSGESTLLLNATGLNRGRVWLNGYDVGRYYLLARNDGTYCPAAEVPGTCDPSSYNNSAPCVHGCPAPPPRSCYPLPTPSPLSRLLHIPHPRSHCISAGRQMRTRHTWPALPHFA